MSINRSRAVAAPAIAVIVAVCVAACGSSGSTSTSSSSAAAATSTAGGPAANRTKLVACLKQHGVTLPARPRSGGGYGPPPGSAGPNNGAARGQFGNPKFRAAFKACGATAGFRGRGNFRPSSAAITRFAGCVKQHGYTLPRANLTGKGPVYPVSIERNPTFQAASRSCQSLLRPAGAAGPAGGAAGSAGGGAPPAA